MTPTPPLPACCTPLLDHWPFPEAVAGARLLSTGFDPARLDPEDFARWGIPQPRGVSKRQAEYLAGRLCAHQALRCVTGRPGVPATAEDRSPVWPAGVVGSITHGAGWAAAVVASNTACRGIGLDVERLLAATRAERLAGEILVPDELAQLNGLDEASRAERITLAFSFKESLFKALYPMVRQRFYFEAAQVTELAEGHARLRLLADLTPEWRTGVELRGQYAEVDGRLLTLVSIPA
ncbi:4'-phosphopantetheinyl transferase family protein [Stutzerimonas azotifigens]|uniref:4'-phosphopantetheinyl transferase family protein n=1 Tax=Stutzerimonas azotifigens TaxID=291995 RepID=UPI000481461C|nr:4'-phosphopantetheinyl transferase superfamily protein [Stutzerimonas azotifigens]